MDYNTVVTTIDDKNHIVLTANDFALIIKKYAGEDDMASLNYTIKKRTLCLKI